MVKRWWVLLYLVCIIGLFFTFPVLADCDGDGICEPGENTGFCEDCNSAFCGDGQCDTGVDENCNTCVSDCGLCDGESCNSSSVCFGGWCTCFECSSVEPPSTYCCLDSDCPTSYGEWQLSCQDSTTVLKERTVTERLCSNLDCVESETTVEQEFIACPGDETCFEGGCGCRPTGLYECDPVRNDLYYTDTCGGFLNG